MKKSCLIVCLCVFLLTNISECAVKKGKESFIQELTALNITSNADDWETDLAIVFYAPWCRYCKQLLATWEEIAYLTRNYNSLVVGKFNCETPSKNAEICSVLKIDRYPTVAYLGYGSFNQAPPKNIFGKSTFPRFARFTADLYPEAIYDWMRMLYSVGVAQRKWDDVMGFFTGKSRAQKKVEKLKSKMGKLQDKVELFSKELERYKSNELFDKLEDLGDPYPLLAVMEPDAKNLPFRVCVGEMALEYCKYTDEDVACKAMPACVADNMAPKVCRPEVCPFSKRGCRVVSMCLKPDVIEQYKKYLTKAESK